MRPGLTILLVIVSSLIGCSTQRPEIALITLSVPGGSAEDVDLSIRGPFALPLRSSTGAARVTLISREQSAEIYVESGSPVAAPRFFHDVRSAIDALARGHGEVQVVGVRLLPAGEAVPSPTPTMKPAFKVTIDAARAGAYGLTLIEISNHVSALRKAGLLNPNSADVGQRLLDSTVKSINGAPLRLSDVARVELTMQPDLVISKSPVP